MAPLYLTGPAGSVIAGGLTLLAGIAGAIGGEQVAYTLADAISTAFTAAQNFVQLRSDPLVLDLDGDGLETIGINASTPIYFDHDGDGNESSSGWVEAHPHQARVHTHPTTET